MSQSDAAIATEVEAACRQYIAAYPAALWRYFTDGTPVNYDALGFWSFPMLFIIGSSESSSVTIVDQTTFDAMVRAVYEKYHAEGWGGSLRIDSAKV